MQPLYFAILHRQCLWSATLISLFHERCIHIAVVRSRRRWWGVLKMRKLRYAQIACQSGVECGEQFGLSALQGSSARSAVSVVQRSATLFHFSVLQREKAPQPFEQKKRGCLCNLFYFAILHRQCLWYATLISLFHERCIHIAVVRSRRRCALPAGREVCLYCVLRQIALPPSISLAQTFTKQSPTAQVRYVISFSCVAKRKGDAAF